MKTFCQRLRHPFRRPTHYYTIVEPSRTLGQLGRQREREIQRALDEIENDVDDGRVRPRGSSSPDSLPVIFNKGPYRGCFYPKDQLYFNSIMVAADVEPRYAGPPGGELRQETSRTPIWRPRGRNNRSPSPRPVPSEWLTASQNAENIRQWEERNDINPTPARTKPPSSMQPSARPPSPPRGPITPGTQEWDKFMDFPLDNSYHIHRDDHHDRSAEIPAAFKTPASSEPAVVTETQVPLISYDVHAVPQAQVRRLLPLTQTNAPTKLPGISPVEAEPTQVLTWNSALNSIFRNEAVDPATRATIRERVQHSSTTGRSEYEETPPVTPADVDLVPNFSYPIVASAFYDRFGVAQAPQTRSVQEEEEEEQRHGELLPNGVRPEYCSHASSNDTLYRDPTPPNWPLRGGQDGDHTPLTNGVPLGYYPPSSSDDSSNTSIDPRQRSPSPPNLIPEQVSELLRSILTSSELALHYQIVHGTAPTGTSVLVGHAPQHTNLIRKLDTAVYGLQDRVAGLEDDLIPQLSTWLEQKDRELREQDVEISHLKDEITALKRAVDFSTRILKQCQEREWEFWRTLLDIQRKREEKRNPLVCIFSRTRSNIVQDAEAGVSSAPQDYATQPLPSGSAIKGS